MATSEQHIGSSYNFQTNKKDADGKASQADISAYLTEEADTALQTEPTLWRRLAIEALGSFALAFNAELASGNPQSAPIIGFFLVTILFLGLQISGSHMNPAITLMVIVRYGMNLFHAGIMIGVQILFAFLGAVSAYTIIETRHRDSLPDPYLPAGKDIAPTDPVLLQVHRETGYPISLLIEFSLTFGFCAIALTCASAAKNRVSTIQMLILGAYTMACCAVFGNVSGAVLNPAVCIALSIVGAFRFEDAGIRDIWVYLISVPLGGIAAGFTFKMIHRYQAKNYDRIHQSFRINNGIERHEAAEREMARLTGNNVHSSSSSPTVGTSAPSTPTSFSGPSAGLASTNIGSHNNV